MSLNVIAIERVPILVIDYPKATSLCLNDISFPKDQLICILYTLWHAHIGYIIYISKGGPILMMEMHDSCSYNITSIVLYVLESCHNTVDAFDITSRCFHVVKLCIVLFTCSLHNNFNSYDEHKNTVTQVVSAGT